jgi:hypothetical protein
MDDAVELLKHNAQEEEFVVYAPRETSKNAPAFVRWHISRVENGHIVPAIETLEKISRGLEVPMYQLFCDGQELPETPIFPGNSGDEDWASHGKGKRLFIKLRHALSLTNGADSSLLLHLAKKMSDEKRRAHR